MELLQIAMDSYYKLRQLFYYNVRWLLQIATVHSRRFCMTFVGHMFFKWDEMS